MGIRGLSTFIAQNSDRYLEDYKLKDCQLVIDGNSLTAQLYTNSSNFHCAFGGDYDRYAVCVIEFFDLLKKCRIKPLVVFDGGYEKHKLKTTYVRLKQKWSRAKRITPMTQNQSKVFPCLLREAFKDVLRELRIPFAQCLFEADEEIAAIAKQLKCPVLSYDSDFFVYDVLYIPFPTLRLYLYKDKFAEGCNVSYYLSCSLYRVENFLKCYGGLSKEILPFFAIMLGNDYIGNRVFKNFMSRLKQQKSHKYNRRQRGIAALLQWLRNETLESATAKLMTCLRKEKRQHVTEQVRRVIALYVECSSDLLPILGIKDCNPEIQMSNEMNNVKQLLEKQLHINENFHGCGDEANVDDDEFKDDTNTGEIDEFRDDLSSSISSSSEEEEEEEQEQEEDDKEDEDDEEGAEKEENIDQNVKVLDKENADGKVKAYGLFEIEKASCLPEWFLEKFQQGAMPPPLMDMFTFGHYFVLPQVEDYHYHSSHTISIPIIGVIYGLMVGGESGNFLKCFIRMKFNSKPYTIVYPVLKTESIKFSSLEHLSKLTVHQRRLILEETAGLSIIDRELVALLPPAWQLYIISIVFWVRKCNQTEVNTSHVQTLLLCLLLLDVVSKKSVCLGSTRQTCKKRTKVVKMANSQGNDKDVPKLMQSMSNQVLSNVLSESGSDVCIRNVLKVKQIDGGDRQDFVISQQESDPCEKEDLHKKSLSLAQCLETINSEECVLVKKILRPFSLMDEKMKTRPKLFCITTVHVFAQFQSCLLHFTYLNALLGLPFPPCSSYRVFCGTFVYNFYHNVIQRTNVIAYITRLLSVAPTMLSLFTTLREIVEKLVPEVPMTDQMKKKSHKKKRQSQTKKEEIDVFKDIQGESTDTEFDDPCNRFTALSIKQ